MSINRETIHAALFTKLQGLATSPTLAFNTVERTLRHWSDVAPEDMPYLAMTGKSQRVEQQQRTPPKYTLPVDLYVYVSRKGDASNAASALLNLALDAIDRVLEPAHMAYFPEQTLGVQQVKHCRVQGDIVTDEGTLGDIAVAIVPVEIIAAG